MSTVPYSFTIAGHACDDLDTVSELLRFDESVLQPAGDKVVVNGNI